MKKTLVAFALLVPVFAVLLQLGDPAGHAEPLARTIEAGAMVSPQVTFSGGLRVGGTIDAQAGVRFPDGTVQLSAAAASAPDLTANAGLYDNRIVEISPALPYVEVCFKNGDFDFDVHVNGGDSTDGGDCLPGDVGWVIEREERVTAFWEDARAECLQDGMRLPEAFEFLFSCRRAAQLGLLDMTGNYEWASNQASPFLIADVGLGQVVGVLGNSGCDSGSVRFIARSDPPSQTVPFRCVR